MSVGKHRCGPAMTEHDGLGHKAKHHSVDSQQKKLRKKSKQRMVKARNDSVKRGESLASLVLPWAAIVGCAVLASAVLAMQPDESTPADGADAAWTRQLHTDDGYVPPTDDFTYDHSASTHASHHHKPVFVEEHDPLFPLTTRDYVGFILAVMGLMIAAGGGIGGGGILVPIYILVMDFSPKHAIPLSNITVFGGAVANTLLNTRKRHPLADRPLVDWDLILVMEPLSTSLFRNVHPLLLASRSHNCFFFCQLLPERSLVPFSTKSYRSFCLPSYWFYSFPSLHGIHSKRPLKCTAKSRK